MKNLHKLGKIFLLSLLIFLPKTAFADGFDHINIDVDIDKNGIGNIREEWQIDERDNDFTERYKNIQNLKGLKIEDFSVSMDSKNFSPKDQWDIDENFDQKAYKYGRIDYSDDDVDLCWGHIRT